MSTQPNPQPTAPSDRVLASTGDEISNARIETLADGVFAIVLTLLVLDIKAPIAASDAELIRQLVALIPKFFAYVLSFIILGLFWFGHQMVSRYIRRSNRTHIWLNLLFLMCIAFIPFSAALLGENTQMRTPTIVYGINLLAASSIRYLHWQYLTSDRHLVEIKLDKKQIQAVRRTFLVAPLICTLAIGTSFINVYVSLALYAFSIIIGAMKMNAILHNSRQNEA